jgi:zeaxanthin glucosyltransferase
MKIGFLSLPLSGHLNPMTALARKLQARGNDVVFISVPDGEPALRAAHLKYIPFCEQEFPAGSIGKLWSSVARLEGEEVVRHSTLKLMPGLSKAGFEHLPAKIAEHGIEALVFDSIYFYLSLVAKHLGIPYVTIWCVLNMDFSGSTPPCLFPGSCETTPEALARNAEALKTMGEMMAPLAEGAVPYAEKAGLEVEWHDPNAATSQLAVISQTPKEFDFPGIPWPAQFHYTGPFHDGAGREKVPFPWERLTGKPLVYASMGTLLNGSKYVYRTILDAVKPLSGIQLVLAVGHNINIDDLGPIPSNAVVVSSAPQMELLRRAELCITHAGLNTVLEALAQGVPMVAIPVGYDQPGVAARIRYHGVGDFLELSELTVSRLSELIHRVRTNQRYHDKASYMQRVIERTRGLDRAAEIVEQAFGIDRATATEDVALSHA